MKNKEKYAKEIFEIACSGNPVALDKKTMQPVSCADISCHDCSFGCLYNKCSEDCAKWCESEYVEPPVDWSKVPIDTPILVSNNNRVWAKRYFAKYEDGNIYAWDSGKTSWSVDCNNEVTVWIYAKLADKNMHGRMFGTDTGNQQREAWQE